MLIIWDFDGVICCDSDYIWAENWQKLLREEKNIRLSNDEVENLLIGISEKDKKNKLERHFPDLNIDDVFMDKLNKLHFERRNLLTLTAGVEDIFKDKRFTQCIATGGNSHQNRTKNHTVGIDKYFTDQNCFTADMVLHGKPAPDLFLLAAKSMNFHVSECVVIEDAISGITAAKAAGMKCFAFVGAKANNNPEYRKKCLNAGADNIYDDMTKLHQDLRKLSDGNVGGFITNNLKRTINY